MSKSKIMTEKTIATSSMTSVTSEDTSADSESDTTESYSNVTSSPLNTSTDYNTDDKLTPGLNNIQISNLNNASIGGSTQGNQLSSTSVQRAPSLSSNPQDHAKRDKMTSGFSFGVFHPPHPVKRKEKKRKGSADLLKKTFVLNSNKSRKQYMASTEENLGVNDPENKLSTDFSDTSSKFDAANNQNDSHDNSVSEEEEDAPEGEGNVFHHGHAGAAASGNRKDSRTYFPDMTSQSWHQARCFDPYWSMYGFVMEWYQQHVQAVRALSGFPEGGMGIPPQRPQHQGTTTTKSRRKSRRSQRARKRRKVKEQQARSLSRGSRAGDGQQESEDSNEMEMTITDDMMTFFAQSLKHRIERDSEKTKEDEALTLAEKLGSEQASSHRSRPTVSAPREQPGVRRTCEMRSLYGTGAPMVHGMETALQMSFDRITDKHQPKLWPNMPLHLVFK